MHASSILAAIAVLASGALASPVANNGTNAFNQDLADAGGDNCQNYLGDCYGNGCAGGFAQPTDTTGTCTAGSYNGCPCEKCGGSSGSYVGSCSDNDCLGVQGVCSSGQYEGCSCN